MTYPFQVQNQLTDQSSASQAHDASVLPVRVIKSHREPLETVS